MNFRKVLVLEIDRFLDKKRFQEYEKSRVNPVKRAVIVTTPSKIPSFAQSI
jgi:hypothetical protein